MSTEFQSGMFPLSIGSVESTQNKRVAIIVNHRSSEQLATVSTEVNDDARRRLAWEKKRTQRGRSKDRVEFLVIFILIIYLIFI